MFDNSPNAVFLMDEKFVTCNDSACRLLGDSREQILSRTLFDYLPEDSRSMYDDVVAVIGAARNGESQSRQWHLKRRDGELVDVEISFVNLDVQESERLLVIMRDITEHERTIRALQERSEFISTVSDNLPIGFAVTTFSGDNPKETPPKEQKNVYINQEMEKILGWPKEMIPTLEDFFEKVFPDKAYREEVYKSTGVNSSSPGSQHYYSEIMITRKSGEQAEVLMTDIPLFDQQMVITTMQDITERKKAQRLQAQLDFAAEVQAKLLPQDKPDVAGFDIAAWCQPAYEVGGDFYDWQELSPGLLNLTLGDVMGKGVAASILMATVRAALRAAPLGSTPEATIGTVSQALQRDLNCSESFVTLFHAQLDSDHKRLTYVDCGHGWAFCRRHDGSVENLQVSGLPLGVSDGEEYRQMSISMTAGDAVVIFSDGLIDAFPDDPPEMPVFAEQLNGAGSADEMVQSLINFLPAGATRHDDITLLVVRCSDPSPS